MEKEKEKISLQILATKKEITASLDYGKWVTAKNNKLYVWLLRALKNPNGYDVEITEEKNVKN